jgi:hypothetical protein
MANNITCPHCNKTFEAGEALTHQIKEEVSQALQMKFKQDLELETKKATAEAVAAAGKDLEYEKEKNKKLSGQLDELIDETRKLRQRDEERELQMKKKLLEEEVKIKEEARRKFEEEHSLKDTEKEKIINDLKRALEEARAKAEQGSQQTQGESLELTLEATLKQEYPMDIIEEVKKGVKGADLTQTVIDKKGQQCGTILWESKNAKWSETWIAKLKEDQRQAKADLAVLVTVHLPPGIDVYGFRNGVWVCSWKSFIHLALALRFNLVNIYYEKQNLTGADEKMRVLYDYLTGNEFKHRVEGIVEAFGTLQDDIEKEKRWFSAKWARQEKEIRKVIDHTHGLYGDLQGVTGRSLPEIKSLQIEDGAN